MTDPKRLRPFLDEAKRFVTKPLLSDEPPEVRARGYGWLARPQRHLFLCGWVLLFFGFVVFLAHQASHGFVLCDEWLDNLILPLIGVGFILAGFLPKRGESDAGT